MVIVVKCLEGRSSSLVNKEAPLSEGCLRRNEEAALQVMGPSDASQSGGST